MEAKHYKIGIIITHPIQYYSPLYRSLSAHPQIELKVYFCHNQTPENQGQSGFGVKFDWDIDLFDGFNYQYLKNVSSFPNVDNFRGCNTPEIYKEIKNQKFDAFIVSGWYVKSYIQAIIACWKTKTPLIVRSDSHLNTSRSYLRRIVKYPLYRLFLSIFNAYLFVGQKSKEYFLYYGADINKMFFSPHAVDNNYFSEKSNIDNIKLAEIKNELKIPEESVVFLFVGKFIDIKKPMDFLKAIKTSSENNKKVFGIMVGDGELKDDCMNFINKNSLNVRCLGFLNQSKLPEIYAISDVLVMTSESETWGLAVNEAMASGLTVICSDGVGCTSDLVLEGKTGNIYEKGNIDLLSKKINHLANNIDLLSNMKKSANKHIENYSFEKNVENILNAIKFVTKN